MKVGIRRREYHDVRTAHVVDSRTRRGFILNYAADEWDMVRIQNLPVGDRLQTTKFLADNLYIPMEIPDEEFNSLYDTSKLRGFLSRNVGGLDPSKTPNLRDIIEENQVAYMERVAKIMEQVRSSYEPYRAADDTSFQRN